MRPTTALVEIRIPMIVRPSGIRGKEGRDPDWRDRTHRGYSDRAMDTTMLSAYEAALRRAVATLPNEF